MRKSPVVSEVTLKKSYQFMYEHFVLSTQHDLYLFLEKNSGLIDALKFCFLIFKYGYPNDEVRGGHPLAKHGLGFYGLYEVNDSPWIEEVMSKNRIHPHHNDNIFSGYRHFIACFKDVTLEVMCRSMEEIQLSESDLADIVKKESGYLANK